MAAIADKIKERLEKRYSIRLHMTFILLAVTLCGALLGKILLIAGIVSMPVRFTITVIAAYLVFLILVRLWLWYVSPTRNSSRPGTSSNFNGDTAFDLPDIGGGAAEGAGKAAGETGGGGSFGGGGATGNWGVPIRVAAADAGTTSSSSGAGASSGSSGGFSLDVDDARGLLLIAAFAIVAAVVAGVWVYLVYQAPVILSEALFQTLLASGLYKKTRQMHEAGWAGSVIKATVIPLLVVIATAVALGLTVNYLCPQATKLTEAVKACVL